VIAFGVSATDGEAYRRYAHPGLELAKEPDSEVYVFAAVGQAARTYNLLIEAAARHDDLEALVLVHPHTQITDRALGAKIRRALSDPEVAVVGAAGAKGVRTIAWWEGDMSRGAVTQAYHEYGGGKLPAFAWKPNDPPPQEVDAVDGMLMILSPWAVGNINFDEALALGHGYDVDYCFQARQAGRKVVTADIALDYHQSLELLRDHSLWVEAHIQVAEKWHRRIPGDDPTNEAPSEEDWKRRARRAEAQREVARSIAYGSALSLDARVLALERQLRWTEGTWSWRMTEPLRRLNRWRLSRNGAGAGP
jgi:hypothetical protein